MSDVIGLEGNEMLLTQGLNSEAHEELVSKYSKFAERFGQLGIKSLKEGLTDEEKKERKNLEVMSFFGLFERLNPLSLKELSENYEAFMRQVNEQEKLWNEYQRLNKKQYAANLRPEEIMRQNYLMEFFSKLKKFDLFDDSLLKNRQPVLLMNLKKPV